MIPLLNWIAGLFRSRDADRNIFVFTVAGKRHRVDPLAAFISLRDNPKFDWAQDPFAADAGDGAAMARTMQAIDDAFGIKDLSQGGATIAERMSLLASFSEWCDAQKKTAEPSQMESPTSDSLSNDSTTPKPSESSSIEIGPSCGEVSQSASESAAP